MSKQLGHRVRLVLSLSTIPSRVAYLPETLQRLERLCLRERPDRIYLNVPRWSQRERKRYPSLKKLRRFLRRSSLRDLVVIHRSRDLGPITKLAPTLKREPDPETMIVTLDDDMAYDEDRLEQLVQAARAHPEAAIGGDGWIMGSWYNFYGWVIDPPETTPVSIIQGCSGCLYRRGFFGRDLLTYPDDETVRKSAFLNDDIWISGYLARKGIPRLVHPGYRKREAETSMINRISANPVRMLIKLLPVLWYFRRDFTEVQVAPLKRRVGSLIVLILLVPVLLLVWFGWRQLRGRTGQALLVRSIDG